MIDQKTFDKKMFILSGLPGSGKTTVGRKIISGRPNGLILSPDALRYMLKGAYTYDEKLEPTVERLYHIMVLKVLSMGVGPIVVDEVNLTRRDRLVFIEMAKQAGYLPVIVYCKVPLEVSLRNRLRKTRGYSTAVWKKVIHQMHRYMIEPSECEGCTVIPDHTIMVTEVRNNKPIEFGVPD